MGIFSKKPKVRFETITIDREREVFRALESRGWILCDEPFQFDVKKPPEKLRKDAKSVAKDLHGELIVEIFDPIYQNMPWKGLRYAVWRKATRDEMAERIKKQQAMARPDYKDTMGSYEDIHRKLDEKRIKISDEDLHALDSVVSTGNVDTRGDLDGKTKQELEEATEAIKAISTFNPYDHQGEEGHEMDEPSSAQGPVFEESMKLESVEEEGDKASADIDGMSMMLEAATEPPAPTEKAEPPVEAETPSPPAVAPEGGVPEVSPEAGKPEESPRASPPANLPAPPQFSPPPAPSKKEEKKEEKEGGQ